MRTSSPVIALSGAGAGSCFFVCVGVVVRPSQFEPHGRRSCLGEMVQVSRIEPSMCTQRGCQGLDRLGVFDSGMEKVMMLWSFSSSNRSPGRLSDFDRLQQASRSTAEVLLPQSTL